MVGSIALPVRLLNAQTLPEITPTHSATDKVAIAKNAFNRNVIVPRPIIVGRH